MNKYTLRFLDKKAEQLYQEFKTSYILQPVFEKCSWLVIIFIIISLIGKLTRRNYPSAMIQVAIIIYMLIQIYIIKRRKQYIKFILGFTNILFIFYEITLSGKEDPYFAFLFGSNLMITHCVILFASDFIEGLVQGIFVFSGKIIITKIYSDDSNWEIYIASLTYFLLIEVLIYKCSQGLRLSYLLSLKTDQWQNLLIRLVDKHFICFCYDDETVSFQQILTNNQTITMKQLFRESKHHGQTVENILFKMHTQQNLNNLKIDATFNRTNIGIQLSQFHLEKTFYLAIIDYHEIREDQLINRLLIKYICQSTSLIRKYIKTQNNGVLYKMYLRNLEIINLYKCTSNRIKVREFSLTSLLKTYSNILKHCHIDTKIYYFSHENFQVQYFKEEIKLFFIRIFTQVHPIRQILRVLLRRDKDRIKIIIDGYVNPLVLQKQHDLMKKLFDSYRITQQCINIVYQLELVLYIRFQ